MRRDAGKHAPSGERDECAAGSAWIVLLSVLRRQTSSSPAMNRRASCGSRACEKFGGRRCSRSRGRDACSTISPASRRASPRSCVDITTLMPRAATARIDVLDRLGRGRDRGSRSARRGTAPAGSRASARASASRCCSPPDSRRAGRAPRPASPTRPNKSSIRDGHSRAATPALASAYSDVGGGAAAQHDRALEHDGAPRRRHAGAAAPGDLAARSARSVPWRRAAAWSCRRRSARSARSARRA